MSIYFKIGFLIFVLLFGFIIISPLIRKMNQGTEIVFFGVGNADSMLVRNKSGTILIDTGLKKDEEILADKLKVLGVKTIDYMILTHPDKDHIGGASYVLDNFNVKNLIQSKLRKGTKTEKRIEESLEEKPVNNMVLEEDYEFDLGDLEISIYSPKEESYDKSNDYSLVTFIKDGDLNYLFAGDAEELLLGELLSRDIPKLDLYKLPHHGKWKNNSGDLIEELSPEIGVITNRKADERVIDALESREIEYYFVYGEDLYFYSDGLEIERR